jgi:GH15 family glucan-1,4-alpha-glucosidase
MPGRIEDYALIGDCQTAALVCRNGSLDWLCVPRFDSAACFAALLGTPNNGRWLLAPRGEVRASCRRYREGTLVLETEYETAEGVAAVIDFMPIRDREWVPNLVRVVEGRRGRVAMHTEVIIRFDYGVTVPWVQRIEGGLEAIAGPDALRLLSPVPLHGKDLTTAGQFMVAAGERIPFTLTRFRSYVPAPQPIDPLAALEDTDHWWRQWSRRCACPGPYTQAIVRSLITLKALTYAPTGGIVAAATTSLPEQLGGVRNWDYRYCWLRDATFTRYALHHAGYHEEARAWRQWLLRTVAGDPAGTQIMYGLAGERRLTEFELPWLPGYEGARPVRVGNAASGQFQLDVYGEVLDAMYQSRKEGLRLPPAGPGERGAEEACWNLERALVEFLESAWDRPDEGLWEVRGPRRKFTHSKVMTWVAFDRAVKSIEAFGLPGPVERWRWLRDAIHEQVCRDGFDSRRNTFVQSLGSRELDASLLLIRLVGFLPPSDPRVVGTVEAISRDLCHDGFVARYDTSTDVDRLQAGEGAFLACTFWLADNLLLLGRHEDARAVFERLLDLRNDVGLLSEEYDPHARRLVGSFPQAFSHVGLVNTALNLSRTTGPAHQRMHS